jgi:FdhD protein
VPALKDVDVLRVRAGRRALERDRAAVEEPLEVRLHGRPFAVIMRTPGADRELTAGFLLSERVLRSADDLGTIEHCRNASRHPADEPGARAADVDDTVENVVNVTLIGRSAADLDGMLAERRQTLTNSSCGMCGRLTIDSLRADIETTVPAVRRGVDLRMAPAALSSLPDRLRRAQAVFDETGGLHAAGLFTADATLVAIAEDVGRHNAVDKVIGRMLMADELPLSSHALFVSGRASFEIVQKALFAGISVVAAVSAPSSLAIDLATETGITLAGFVRGDGFNVYAHRERIS